MALLRWEPRIRLTHFRVSLNLDGSMIAELYATRTDTEKSDQTIQLSIPLTGSNA